ncbi:MAG TPA: hypothetical protein VE526_13075 [Solirubrobacteraceae bacterium]|nr:hypothetical protein [Solirubrobacteraceae bacterium]
MQFPSRRARVALLAGVGTLAIAAPASAAVTSDYNTTTKELSVSITDATSLDIVCDTNNIKVNGANPTRDGADNGTTGCAAPTSLKVLELDANTGENDVDLRGVTASSFTSLATSTINMGGGKDTVVGTEIADTIDPGDADDTVSGFDGNDTLIWNPGDDSDTMNGGDGVDTVVDNGGGGDETFEIKPRPNEAGRVDVARTIPAAAFFSLNVGGTEKLDVNGNGGNDTITGFPGIDGVLKVKMTGGDGNDALAGTDAADDMDGGAGNDTLDGDKGNDDMSGDDGDDIMIWNPGDGSDKMEGGAGNDTAQDNGGGGNEHFIVSAQGQRVTATRDNAAPFFLDIGTSETLDLNANGGDDAVEIENGIGTLIKVDANLGDGNDTIEARNTSADLIDGAAGTDTAVVDATDQVSNVETVDAPVATPPADTTKPQVAIDSKQLKVKNGKAAVKVTCPAGESSCDGKITIKRNGKAVGSIATKLVGGQTKTYQVQLNRSTRIALATAPGKKLAVKVVVTAKDAAGNTAKTTKELNLKGATVNAGSQG